MDKKLQDAIAKANSEIEGLKISDPELKKIAFSKAIDFYLYGEQEYPQKTEVAGADKIADTKKADFWKSLSGSVGIEEGKLEDVFALKNEQILLVIPDVPGNSKVARQRNLASLILLSYHEGLKYEWVPSNLLAEAAKHSKLYDTSKFAKNLKFDWFRSYGVKKGLKYKLSGPGTSAAKNLLANLIKNYG